MLKILDRYIIKKFFKTLSMILLMTIVIVVLIDYTEKNDAFIKHGLTFQEIMQYFLSFVPFIINMTMPLIIFLTTVFVTSKLAKHSEIIAILSHGISFLRLLFPYIICATFIAIFSFVFNGWILGKANKFRIFFETTYINNQENKNNVSRHIQLNANTYMYVKYYDTLMHEGSDISIDKVSKNKLIERITAKYMQWNAKEKNWTLHHWQKFLFKDNKIIEQQGNNLLIDSFDLIPEDFRNDYKLNEALTLTELNAYIQKLQSRGSDNTQIFLVEKYIKYMSPFSALILTAIGFLTACSRVRGGMAKKIALGGVLATIYVALFLFTKVLAEVSTGNILLTIWTPNIVFTILIMFFYRYTPK